MLPNYILAAILSMSLASSGVPTGGMKSLVVADATSIDPVNTTAGPNVGAPVGASGSGWVAIVVLSGITNLGGTCDPSALTLNVTDPGFDSSGNATTVSRTITGVSILRRQYPNGGSKMISTDGTDLTVYISLNDWVYTGTTVVSATIGGTFYTGCTAGNTGSNYANLSLTAYTKPVFGWMNSQVAYNPSSSLYFEAVAFHRHARNGRQAAAIKFTGSDGTHTAPVITVASTTLSTIQTQGNIAEVYAGTLDTSGLNQGACTLTAKVYPWLGDSTAVLDLVADGVTWPTSLPYTPLNFFNDPAVTYGGGIAYVQVGASGGTVSSTAATARAAPFPTIAAAMNALATWNNTNSAGHSVLHLDHGGGSIRFMDAAGSAVTHTIAGGPTLRTQATYCEVTKDPLATGAVTLQWSALATFPSLMKWTGGLIIDQNGAGTWCIMGPSAAAGSIVWLSGLTSVGVTNKSMSGYCQIVYADNITLTIASTTMLQLGGATSGVAKAIGIVSSTTPAFHKDQPKLEIGNIQPGRTAQVDTNVGDHGRILYNNRYNCCVFVNASAVTLNLGIAQVQNLYESDGSLSVAAINMFADGDLTTVSNYIEQHNTGVGNRCSRMYNDATASKVTPHGIAKIGSHRYNVWDNYNIKCDTFTSGQGSTGNWAEAYNVGNDGNVSLFGNVNRAAADTPHNDNGDVPYLGMAWLPSSEYNLFRTGLGFTQAQIMAMFGNYTVGPKASPAVGGSYVPTGTAANLKNRVPVNFSTLKYDIAGTIRRTDGTGAAGAYESL